MMSDSAKKAASPENLWHRAGHLLDRSDQWFASSAGRMLSWAQRGGERATEHTVLALAEAMGVTRPAPDGNLRVGKLQTSASVPDPLPAADTADLDLLWTEPPAAAEAAPAESALESRLAGVVPLLQALGRIVAQHAERDYTSLAGDDRFWMLVDALHSLTSTDSSRDVEPHSGSQRERS